MRDGLHRCPLLLHHQSRAPLRAGGRHSRFEKIRPCLDGRCMRGYGGGARKAACLTKAKREMQGRLGLRFGPPFFSRLWSFGIANDIAIMEPFRGLYSRTRDLRATTGCWFEGRRGSSDMRACASQSAPSTIDRLSTCLETTIMKANPSFSERSLPPSPSLLRQPASASFRTSTRVPARKATISFSSRRTGAVLSCPSTMPPRSATYLFPLP